MLTLNDCRKLLNDDNLTEERAKVILEFLYAFCREIVKNNVEKYENSITETNRSK